MRISCLSSVPFQASYHQMILGEILAGSAKLSYSLSSLYFTDSSRRIDEL